MRERALSEAHGRGYADGMETITGTAAPATGLSHLAKWGLGLSLGALLLPILGLAAFGVAIALLVRSEIGPGLGVLILTPFTMLFGIGLAIGFMGA